MSARFWGPFHCEHVADARTRIARKKTTPAEETPQTINFTAAEKAKVLAKNAATLADFAATALIAAEQLSIKTKPLEHFTLSPDQREILLAVPSVSDSIKTKLAKDKASFTVSEVASMAMTPAELSIDDDLRQQLGILLVAKHLTERFQAGIAEVEEAKLSKSKKPKTNADPNTVFQFKVMLIDAKPPIWRRIQDADCHDPRMFKKITSPKST